MNATIQVGLFADGRPVAVSQRMSTDLSAGNDWHYRLPDVSNAAWGWKVELMPQRSVRPEASLRDKMLGDLWLPVRVIASGQDGTMCGPAAPGMLYTGVSDCPSVTWIPAYQYRDDSPYAYQVLLSVVSRE